MISRMCCYLMMSSCATATTTCAQFACALLKRPIALPCNSCSKHQATACTLQCSPYTLMVLLLLYGLKR
jgi:hypothetical protein